MLLYDAISASLQEPLLGQRPAKLAVVGGFFVQRFGRHGAIYPPRNETNQRVPLPQGSSAPGRLPPEMDFVQDPASMRVLEFPRLPGEQKPTVR